MNVHAFVRACTGCGALIASNLLAQNTRPMEQDLRPGAVSPGRAPAAASQFDPPATPLHPAFTSRPPPPPAQPTPPTDPIVVLKGFSKAYEAAGAPRIAILYNQTFANKITSWTVDAKQVLQMPPSADARGGFSTENLQWIFEEGFAKPFMASGVRLVDPSLVMQAANRRETWREAGQHIADINANVEALKQHTDWVVEVLMVPDSRTITGYLFRTSLKRLADGRIIASGLSTLEEFKATVEKTKVVYDETGYRFVPDESPKPTVDDYAQSIAIKLLLDLTPKLPNYAIATASQP
jgi:hypothetical protein